MKILYWIIDRLDERSTWLSIGVLLSLFGVNIDDETWAMLSEAGAAFCAALIMILPDGKVPNVVSLKKQLKKNGQ